MPHTVVSLFNNIKCGQSTPQVLFLLKKKVRGHLNSKYQNHIKIFTDGSMWHARLLYKLKNIGITGMMFQYFKNVLSEKILMGIPQAYIFNNHCTYPI